MADPRPLDVIRSDLRGARGFAITPSGRERFNELLREARAQCPDGESWKAILRELGLSERDASVS